VGFLPRLPIVQLKDRRVVYAALLGVVTLEVLALVFDPFDRTIQVMHMLLC